MFPKIEFFNQNISAHHVLDDLFKKHKFNENRTNNAFLAKNSGFWNLPEGAEAFLDQIITWRDIGFLHTSKCTDYDQFTSLAGWAQGGGFYYYKYDLI